MSLELSEDVSKEIASKFKLEEVLDIDDAGTEKNGEDADGGGNEGGEEGAGGDGDGNKPKDGEGGEGGEGDESGEAAPKTPIEALIKEYGYEIEDFKGLDIADDSIEGIKKFNTIRDELIKTQAINELFETDEDIKDLVAHKAKGLSIDTWKAKREAETFNIEFKDDDLEGMTGFMVKVYTHKGIPEKRAKLLVEGLKDDGELVAETKKEVQEIKANLERQAATRAAFEAEQIEQEERDAKETIKQVNSIIKEGNLDNVIIPDAERKDFSEFLLSNRLEEKHSKLSLKQRMLIDYIVYKDFKVKGLDKVAAAVAANKKVTPRVRLGQSTGSGSDGDNATEWKWSDLKAKLKGKT